ncbi:MAG: hypothetical protein D6798_06440 [Deltaproteobacteria bacterium]|nr:MAG: hypothetical protein D6798_06440 [Deltaproteobacteria bacterium]
MTRNYDELTGPLNRAVFFRPTRERVRDFLSPHANPVVRIDGHDYPVFDISMNGMAVLAPSNAPLEPGVELDLELRLYDKPVFDGRARVARVGTGGRRVQVGLALTSGFIDLPALARRDEEERMQRELSMGPDPYSDLVPERYRQALSRVVLFVQYQRQALFRHEARYREMGGEEGRRGIEALQQAALERLRAPWTELRLAACAATAEFMEDRARVQAAKQLTEMVLTPLLLDAPCIRRSYEKPLGYPGDYQVMLYCYDQALEGDSVFGRVFHRLWLEHPLPSGVRTRRDLVVDLAIDQHRRLIADSHGTPDLRITSLGCGPAREVPTFIERRPHWPGSVTWTLIDQDEEALSVAYQTAQRATVRSSSDTRLRCLNMSFTQLAQAPGNLPLAANQHFVFSSGLFDYLREPGASELLAVLYDGLAPGGLVAVGNAVGPNEDYWSPGFVLDWTLIYRTRDEMLRLASRLPADAEVQVRLEPGQAYWYLLARKPGRVG